MIQLFSEGQVVWSIVWVEEVVPSIGWPEVGVTVRHEHVADRLKPFGIIHREHSSGEVLVVPFADGQGEGKEGDAVSSTCGQDNGSL